MQKLWRIKMKTSQNAGQKFARQNESADNKSERRTNKKPDKTKRPREPKGKSSPRIKIAQRKRERQSATNAHNQKENIRVVVRADKFGTEIDEFPPPEKELEGENQSNEKRKPDKKNFHKVKIKDAYY